MPDPFVRKEFDSVEAQQGIVRYLGEIVGDFLADIPGTTEPAILLGYQNIPELPYPRIHLLYEGSNDTTSANFEKGLVEVEDPDNPPELITIPYESAYTKYQVGVVIDCGEIDQVLQGVRKSSEYIAKKIRKSFLRDTNLTKFHEYTNSTIRRGMNSIPQTAPDGTRYYDSSLMVFNLSTIDSEFNYDGSFIDTIEFEGKFYRITPDDPNPLEGERSVTSKTP